MGEETINKYAVSGNFIYTHTHTHTHIYTHIYGKQETSSQDRQSLRD